jgi:hypothetical protein
VGLRHHVHPDLAALALPRRGPGPILAESRGVGHGVDHPSRAGLGRCGGRRPAAKAPWDAHPLGSRRAVRQLCAAVLLPGQPPRAQFESQGEAAAESFFSIL